MSGSLEPRGERAPDEDGSGEGGAAELRALYRRLAPPPLADDASEADPDTARVVDWMQRAYRGLAVPPATLPRPALRLAPRRSPRLVLAAAAGLMALAGAALWRALAPSVAPAETPRVARLPTEPPPAPSEAVELLDVRPDRVELRAGTVRLVLLEPPTEPDTDDPSGN